MGGGRSRQIAGDCGRSLDMAPSTKEQCRTPSISFRFFMTSGSGCSVEPSAPIMHLMTSTGSVCGGASTRGERSCPLKMTKSAADLGRLVSARTYGARTSGLQIRRAEAIC